METKTKLLFGLLTLVSVFALSVGVFADSLLPPFHFYKGPVMSGEYFEVDGQVFMQNGPQVYYHLDGLWYLMLPGTYVLEPAPFPATVHMMTDVYCHFDGLMMMNVCSDGEGSGGGGGSG